MIFALKPKHHDDNGGILIKLALENHAMVACAARNFMQSLVKDGVRSK